MLTPVRRRLAAMATVLLVAGLGACDYQTDQVYQPGVGVNNRAGTVDVLGAVVVSSTDGAGTFVASLVNSDPKKSQSLTNVTGDDLEVKLSAPVEIKPDSLVNLDDTGAVSVTGQSVKPGAFARITLEFESGQKTQVNVPVVPYEDEYAEIEPAKPSTSPSGSPSASPSAGATP
jgi:hypothetical protein